MSTQVDIYFKLWKYFYSYNLKHKNEDLIKLILSNQVYYITKGEIYKAIDMFKNIFFIDNLKYVIQKTKAKNIFLDKLSPCDKYNLYIIRL